MTIKSSFGIHPFQRMQADAERQQGQTVRDFDQVGRSQITVLTPEAYIAGTLVTNYATFKVYFNYIFVVEPVFTFGSALDIQTDFAPNAFPQVTAHVISWQYANNTIPVTDSSGLVRQVQAYNESGLFGILPNHPFPGYVGATVGVVATALAGSVLWVHYRFGGSGLPFWNAAGTSETVTG